MPRAYFDTNIYDAIEKGEVPAGEVAAVRAALKRGDLIANFSLSNLEELLGQWEKDRAAAIRRLQVAVDLVGFDAMLKQPSDLLTDEIRAYGEGAVPPSPLLPKRERRVVSGYLRRMVKGSAGADSEVSTIVAAVRAMKEEFRSVMVEASRRALAEWESLHPEHPAVTFGEYFEAGAEEWAGDFADSRGLGAACRTRGLQGLLQVRSVRLAVGALMSLIFSLIIGDGLQPRQPALGNYYDLWHALTAATGDVFVTRDERLASLGRIPITGFRVVRSLGAVLDEAGVVPAC